VPVGLKPLIERAMPPAPGQVPVVIRADLDGDGSNEYVLLLVGEQRPVFAQFFYRAGNDEGGGPWRLAHMSFRLDGGEGFDREDVLEGDVSLTAPKYRNVRIGGVELQAVRQ